MNTLEKITNRIVKKGYPELLKKNIQVRYKSLAKSFFEYGNLSEGRFYGFHIEVDRSLIKAPRKVIEGGIAHELSHILTDKNLGKRLASKDEMAYKISNRYKILDERNTDLEVVIRGYGPQLLSFLKYTEKKGFSYHKKDGLCIRELEILLLLGKK